MIPAVRHRWWQHPPMISSTKSASVAPRATNATQVDLDLIRKYNVPGPRYTSYPPATEFSPEFCRPQLLADLAAGNTTARPLSLYFHLPFCESLCWFCGCSTVISRDHSQAGRYLDYLERELALTARELHPDSEVLQIHFGGGTPNFLPPDQINRLGAMIVQHFRVTPTAEISVELDPRRLTPEHVDAFRALGATRTSFGIQDFNPIVQQAVNRVQPKAVNDRAVAWVRAAGYTSLNLDLMYGLPHQTLESFADTMAQAVTLQPERFAVFNYAHVPWMRPAQRLLEAVLPAPEAKLGMLKLAIEQLTAAGYVYIGMDHFARADDELARAQAAGTLQRNFQGYSTCGGTDVYGFGMSSISQTRTHYRQNEKILSEYCAVLDAGRLPVARAYLLSRDDQIRRHVIMRLMCDLRLDFAAMSRDLEIDFAAYFASELLALAEPAADGLIAWHGGGLTVTEGGRLFIRNLAMIFDAYGTRAERRYSRTI